MRAYELNHLSDPDLLRALITLVARERVTTAELLAHIAEVDARRLYAPAGYASMFGYCVEELRLSEDSAYRRIRAARVARQFPTIFVALAEGRLSLSAIGLLAPHLTRGNATGLLKAAENKTRSEIEDLLASRFPRPELLPIVECLPASCPGSDVRSAPGAADHSERAPRNSGDELVPERVGIARAFGTMSCGAPSMAGPGSACGAKVAPSGAGRFALHVTIGRDTREKLQHAQALLSHKIPSGDLATVLDLALDVLVEKLEKRKFAATDTPRPRRRRSRTDPRHIPAHVKRAVWKRDGGRCTFVGESGHRCNARRFLEFDHVVPVARGGAARIDGLRLRCRAHNQLEAERVFGAGFMEDRRRSARRHGNGEQRTRRGTPAASDDHSADVMAALRSLGVPMEQARRATGLAMAASAATLEERVRTALRLLGPRPRTCVPGAATATNAGAAAGASVRLAAP